MPHHAGGRGWSGRQGTGLAQVLAQNPANGACSVIGTRVYAPPCEARRVRTVRILTGRAV